MSSGVGARLRSLTGRDNHRSTLVCTQHANTAPFPPPPPPLPCPSRPRMAPPARPPIVPWGPSQVRPQERRGMPPPGHTAVHQPLHGDARAQKSGCCGALRRPRARPRHRRHRLGGLLSDLSDLAPGVPDGTGSTGASLLHADLVSKLENPVPHSSKLVRVGGDRDRDRDREGTAGFCYRVVQVRTIWFRIV